jgi:hypothetical protein
MNKFWKIFAITSFLMFAITLTILFFNNSSLKSDIEGLNQTIAQKDSTIKTVTFKKDFLESQLNEYGWKTDLLFMCIGYEGDTAEYPTIKIYNQEEREIGKF